ETNDPDPPLLNRTADDRRWSTQPGGGVKPYFCWSCLSGRLLKTHIPSSAHTISLPPRTRTTAVVRVTMAAWWRVTGKPPRKIDPEFHHRVSSWAVRPLAAVGPASRNSRPRPTRMRITIISPNAARAGPGLSFHCFGSHRERSRSLDAAGITAI